VDSLSVIWGVNSPPLLVFPGEEKRAYITTKPKYTNFHSTN